MTAATMNDELFRTLRDDAGLPEAAAAKVARLIFQQGESAARAERVAGRENLATKVDVADLRAEIPGRDAFAAKGDVDVLKSKAENTDSAIVRIDKTLLRTDERFERIEATIVEIKETAARTDEKVNGLQSQNGLIVRVLIAVFAPLQLLTLGALIGLLTRGILWGVAP